MGICWSWAFGPESDADMLTMDWLTWNTNLAKTSDADRIYTYSGSLTRYSAQHLSSNTNGIMRPPDVAVANWQPGSGGTELQGWVAVPFKRYNATVPSGNIDIIDVRVEASSGQSSNAEVRTQSGTGVLRLYLGGGTFQGSTGVLNFSTWQYVALKFNMPDGGPHTAELWVDGVQEVTGSVSRTTVADTIYVIFGGAGTSSNPWTFGQIIYYDDATDAGQTPYYVTRVSPNADGTDVGTWNPTSGSDHASVTDPFNASTYTQEASPSPGDLVEVLINAGGADIGTQLGVTPTSVQNVTLHTYSTGQLITARAELRDSAGSASTTPGPTTSIDPTSTTYTLVSADAPAGGGSWTGASQPAYVYEVITS